MTLRCLYTGDGVMALFEAPVAHQDSLRRRVTFPRLAACVSSTRGARPSQPYRVRAW